MTAGADSDTTERSIGVADTIGMSASISISEGADGALIAEVIVMLPLRNWARGYNNEWSVQVNEARPRLELYVWVDRWKVHDGVTEWQTS